MLYRVEMVARGQKRKLRRDDEGAGSAWESQLQSVLDISMDKYQRDQALVEPSLLRSVLINNTLRQVQSEVRAKVDSLSPLNQSQPKPQDFPQILSPIDHNAPLFSLNAENVEDDITGWTSEEDFSLSSAISAILKDLDAIIDGPSQRSPLGSIENLPGCSGLRVEKSYFRTEPACAGQDMSLDKLLMDMDASVFEPEVNLLQGFSDDLMKYLPSLSKSPSVSSSVVSPGQPTWEIQEIEHVMDFLMRTYP